jgi:hypothetical protein
MKKAVFWGFAIIAAFALSLVSSEDPILDFLKSESLIKTLSQFTTGNSLIFNLSVGFIVSALFFFIVAYLPEKERKKRIKENIGKVISYTLESMSGNVFHWSKHVRHCKSLPEFYPHMAELIEISKNRKLNALQIKVIVESAHEVLPTYESFTPVALQLSSDHAILWLSLTNSVRQIATLYPCGEEESRAKDLGILDLNLLEFIEATVEWVKLKS